MTRSEGSPGWHFIPAGACFFWDHWSFFLFPGGAQLAMVPPSETFLSGKNSLPGAILSANRGICIPFIWGMQIRSRTISSYFFFFPRLSWATEHSMQAQQHAGYILFFGLLQYLRCFSCSRAQRSFYCQSSCMRLGSGKHYMHP